MKLTNNLKDDLSQAPSWFRENIEKPHKNKILKDIKGAIHYSVWNDRDHIKKIVVLVHGTGAHRKWWQPIAPMLNKDAKIIALDLPGMGDSDFRDNYSIRDFSECIINIINAESNELDRCKIYLVGHSLGGHICSFTASENQNLINGLMIVDTFIAPPDYKPGDTKNGPLRMIKIYPKKEIILKRFRLMPKQECKNTWYLRYIAEHSIKKVKDGWRWKFDDSLFYGLEKLFGYKFSIACPATFIHGETSPLTSSKIVENIKLIYPNVFEYVEIKKSAHHVPLDQPLELIGIINQKIT